MSTMATPATVPDGSALDLDALWAPENRPLVKDAHGNIWSKKQAYLLGLGGRPGRFVIVPGSGQCGKTEAAIPGFLTWLTSCHSGGTTVMLAKGKTQIAEIVKPRIERWCRQHDIEVRWRFDGHEYIDLPSAVGHATNRVWLIAAGAKGKTTQGTSQIVERIQGMTLVGAYIDELTNCSPLLVDMLLSRFMTVPDAKIVGTCNPDGPTHWLKLRWIDRIDNGEIDGEHIRFVIMDHPFITREQAEAASEGWTGVFYRRMYLAEWAAAEGVIYPNVKRGLPQQGAPVAKWEVAIDYAPKRIGAALLIAWVDGRPWIVDEMVTDARLDSMSTADKMAKALIKWCGARGIDTWIVPKDGRDLAAALRANVKGDVIEPVQERLYGINATRILLESILTISRRCVGLLGETDSYAWHPDHPDEPDKDSAAGAHFVDAMRYWAATYWHRVSGEKPSAPQINKR